MLRHRHRLSTFYPARLHRPIHAGLSVLFLLVVGCSTAPQVPPPVPVAEPPAPVDTLGNARLESEQTGNYQDAAREYERLATENQGREQANYLLQQAATLLRANKIIEAADILINLEDESLTPAQSAYQSYLLAQIQLYMDRPTEALATLNAIDADILPENLHDRYLLLHAKALGMNRQFLDMLDERVRLASLLPEKLAEENQKQLWTTLMSLSVDELQTLILQTEDQQIKGWLTLANIARRFPIGSGQTLPHLLTWQITYPQHPANEEILPTLIDRENMVSRPAHIAVLLPESGPLVQVANLIREGMMEGFFLDHAPRPILHFYPVTDETSILSTYLHAVNAGADMVVGPLDKDQVNILRQMRFLPVPLLVLNSLDHVDHWPRNMYRFGLFPEDEVQQSLSLAIRDGYRQLLLIRPDNAWGERLETYLRTLVREPVQILGSSAYDPKSSDFSHSLKTLLHITPSNQRRRSLERLLHTRLQFIPRRRQDIDAVLLLAQPEKARQLRPQLLFQYAADLPVYMTSHGLPPFAESNVLRDLNDTFVVDIPWRLSGKTEIWSYLARLPENQRRLSRFFVLGLDSYQLLPYLEYLRRHPGEFVSGYNGGLSMDKTGKIHRQLHAWMIRGGRLSSKPQVQLDP